MDAIDLRQSQPTILNQGPLDAEPWLDETAWPRFLTSANLRGLIPLVSLPGRDQKEPILGQWEAVLRRLVAQARAAVLTEKISIFDQ